MTAESVDLDLAIPCRACGSECLRSGSRTLGVVGRPGESVTLGVVACRECGEFWFEREGRSLTLDELRACGLI